MSITMLPVGLSTGSPTPIAAAMGSLTMNTSFAPAPMAESRTGALLDLGDPRRHAHDHARLHLEDVLVDDEREEVAQHLLGHVEVGDHAVLHRAHGEDALGRAPSMRFASSPTPLIFFVSRSMATTDGSFRTIPSPLT
jgi:hypothetical protein